MPNIKYVSLDCFLRSVSEGLILFDFFIFHSNFIRIMWTIASRHLYNRIEFIRHHGIPVSPEDFFDFLW